MYKLSKSKRAQVLELMCEGCSIRSISRITGVHKTTIAKLLEDAGQAFSAYQDKHLRNLPCKLVQVDEIWAFCYAKKKNVEKAKCPPRGAGDVWTWIAMDPDSKIVPSWLVGTREGECATIFIKDLESRLKNRIQLTSDGHHAYIEAVEEAFGGQVDYAMLVKTYGKADEEPEIDLRVIEGSPNVDHISTSLIERQNLTVRMCMRRFTRKTNAFSKKLENHVHSVAVHFMYYNFVRVHQTLRVTPAMEIGISKTVITYEDLVDILEEWESLQ